MLCCDDLLTLVSDLFVIPSDELKEPPQRARGEVLMERNGLDILPRNRRQQPSHVSVKQVPSAGRAKQSWNRCKNLLFSETSNVLSRQDRHGATLRGFHEKQFQTRRVASFSTRHQRQ